ncbi:kinase-like domain-containing protein [Suillus lakei]|nr:kinase-like domain-containing protein [Suillus lakei]
MGAEDLPSGRLLCLKVFRKNRLKRIGTGEGLLNELEVYKRLTSSRECCPATIFLMELELSFQTKHNICFVMDLMANDLLHYMDKQSAYCSENARRWTAQLALGINALHSMGIIHRDIKAENILIDIRENVRIADFGLSYMDEEPKRLNPMWDYTSDVKGTIYCMAPEVLRNEKNTGSYKIRDARGLVGLRELFNSDDSIMEYVSWHSKHCGTDELFPPFHLLDPLIADLVLGLLNPLSVLRYGFQQVTSHHYFSNEDGSSEFHDACARALQRTEQPQMMPNLWDEQTRAANIWYPQASWRPTNIPNVDWKKPRPRIVSVL